MNCKCKDQNLCFPFCLSFCQPHTCSVTLALQCFPFWRFFHLFWVPWISKWTWGSADRSIYRMKATEVFVFLLPFLLTRLFLQWPEVTQTWLQCLPGAPHWAVVCRDTDALAPGTAVSKQRGTHWGGNFNGALLLSLPDSTRPSKILNWQIQLGFSVWKSCTVLLILQLFWSQGYSWTNVYLRLDMLVVLIKFVTSVHYRCILWYLFLLYINITWSYMQNYYNKWLAPCIYVTLSNPHRSLIQMDPLGTVVQIPQ